MLLFILLEQITAIDNELGDGILFIIYYVNTKRNYLKISLKNEQLSV